MKEIFAAARSPPVKRFQKFYRNVLIHTLIFRGYPVAPGMKNRAVARKNYRETIARDKTICRAHCVIYLRLFEHRAYLIAHKIINVLVIYIRINGNGRSDIIIKLESIVRKREFRYERLARRAFAAQYRFRIFYSSERFIRLFLLPFPGSGNMSVLVGIAKIRRTAVILIERLHIIDPELPDNFIYLARENFFRFLAGRTHIETRSLRRANFAFKRSVGIGTHYFAEVFSFKLRFFIVRFYNVALKRIPEAAAIQTDQKSAYMRFIDEFFEHIATAERLCHVRRRPRSRPLPMHQKSHYAAVRFFGKTT